MSANTYHVQADWDPEAAVWIATSADVPGLVTEAETIEGLTNKLRIMIRELLEANGLLSDSLQSNPIAFELTSHRHELGACPSAKVALLRVKSPRIAESM